MSVSGYKTELELITAIQSSEDSIKKSRMRMEGIPIPEVEKLPPVTDLIHIPDEQLNEESKKKKRGQRLMKAGWDARLKMKEEKEAIRKKAEDEEREQEIIRLQDPEGWIQKTNQEREVSWLVRPFRLVFFSFLSHHASLYFSSSFYDR